MKDIPAEVLHYILEVLRGVYFGEVVLVAQNGVLIQVERTEKMRVHPWQGVPKPQVWSPIMEENIRKLIERELKSLYYGRITIVVKKGEITHFDRLEKQRFMDGDGI
ncbi:hypothetical protein SAMN05216582_10347 [Selenomonas ruminantium]|uniref:DUF2292 domain-containing protein n=1 Tax=Selenomonas ruminantium TaxID=971 RepID=A0A1M6S0L4_SELRU|nr:YezD family protein [Selenomonas ruminantium]SHK38223.1 hypothetical protein SAMN05216582_10347 [Selenomonas ruminantium]